MTIILEDLNCTSLSNKIQNVSCDVNSNPEDHIVDNWSLELGIVPGKSIFNILVGATNIFPLNNGTFQDRFFFQGNFSMLMKNNISNNKYLPAFGMENYTVDFCSYLDDYTTLIFFKVFEANLKKYGNIFHSCPFSVRIICIKNIRQF